MNNDLHAERIVAILFDYEYVFSSYRLEIKQSIALANIGIPFAHLSVT